MNDMSKRISRRNYYEEGYACYQYHDDEAALEAEELIAESLSTPVPSYISSDLEHKVGLWEDPDFPADDRSLFLGSGVRAFSHVSAVRWRRLDILADVSRRMLIRPVLQGDLGNEVII